MGRLTVGQGPLRGESRHALLDSIAKSKRIGNDGTILIDGSFGRKTQACFSEAATLSSSHFRRPLELSDYLIVSSHLVCVVDDGFTARSDRPHFTVLINREAIEVLNTIEIPRLGGASVSIVGHIALKGTVTHTRISGFPLYIPYIYEFTFSTDHDSWTFHIGDTFKNIYLLPPPVVAPRSAMTLKPLSDPALTVIQLKQLLERQLEHCVARHLRGMNFPGLLQLSKRLASSGVLTSAKSFVALPRVSVNRNNCPILAVLS